MAKKKILLKVENVGDKRVNKHYSLTCNMTNRPDSVSKAPNTKDCRK